MRHQLVLYAFLLFGLSFNSHASPPSVAVDIAPLHSLVSQVMDGIGKPKLLIPSGASPHHHRLRPSDARALENANIVFWIGKDLTPWLDKAVNNLASSAKSVELLHTKGTSSYPSRQGANFEKHSHDDDHHDEDHNDDEHKDDEHKEKEEHHDEDHNKDPHAWLDPVNAKLWVSHISDVLSKFDNENAAIYKQNAEKLTASLDELINATHTQIKELGKPKFIVFHDAYQYFEKRFGLEAAGAIKVGDAKEPSPARIREVQATVKKLGVNCAFSEPQYNPGIINSIFEGSSISTIATMDPLGVSLPKDVELYQALIQEMVNSVSQCLK